MAVEEAQVAEREAINDIQRHSIKISRNKAICDSVPNLAAVGWTGQVSALDVTSSGKAILAVGLRSGIEVKTWNNEFSDLLHGSLIEPSSELYGAVAGLREGDEVSFDGVFFSDSEACIHEQSMTLVGGLRRPEFTFKFSAINKIN